MSYKWQRVEDSVVAIPGFEAPARWILPEKLGFSYPFCTLNLQTCDVPRILKTSFFHIRRGNSTLISEDFLGQIGTNLLALLHRSCDAEDLFADGLTQILGKAIRLFEGLPRFDCAFGGFDRDLP